VDYRIDLWSMGCLVSLALVVEISNTC
jgi:hypothetical protein